MFLVSWIEIFLAREALTIMITRRFPSKTTFRTLAKVDSQKVWVLNHLFFNIKVDVARLHLANKQFAKCVKNKNKIGEGWGWEVVVMKRFTWYHSFKTSQISFESIFSISITNWILTIRLFYKQLIEFGFGFPTTKYFSKFIWFLSIFKFISQWKSQ
jgi:hypothetical protein